MGTLSRLAPGAPRLRSAPWPDGAEIPLKSSTDDADTSPMTRFGGPFSLSRPAVALATVSSCAVVCAAFLGALTPPVVVGALGAAAVTGVLSARSARRQQPRRTILANLPVGTAPSAVTITAPRARDAAATGSVHSAA